MLNKILFVFEGAKTEHRINSTILNCFFKDRNTIVESVFGAEIYQLYKEITESDDLEIFQIIKERTKSNSLSKYSRDDFAEIYLFFDYDGHATLAENHKLEKLLKKFNNETEHGKLLISYPMAESIKHIKNYDEFKNINVCCNINIKYKSLVAQECQDKKYLDFRKYDKSMWQSILKLHLSKMNHIVNDKYELPAAILDQTTIFSNQLAKYITPHSLVGVLSAFPIFIHDYFGNKKTIEFIADENKI